MIEIKRKSIIQNAFFALLFMTILTSLAVFLPKILFKNTMSSLRSSIGFITVKYGYSNNWLIIEITNHYSTPITIVKIVIENNTYWVTDTIMPGNSTRIKVPYNITSSTIDIKITYTIGNSVKTVWKRMFLQK